MDYQKYHFTWKECLLWLGVYLLLDGLISYLFYRSRTAFVLLLPGGICFLKVQRETQKKRRNRRLGSQFLGGMQAVSNALAAGYSVENAFGAAQVEIEKVYGRQEPMVQEFRFIADQLSVNRNLEELLYNLAERSDEEDILNFAEVFGVAKRSGGDLLAIIRNTVRTMQQKEETREEIRVCIAAKQLEQNMMSCVPMMILMYVGFTSPGFLDGMYHNPAGITVMSICLAVYGAAWFLGKKIVEIEV